jgi:pseudouridine kinase
MGRFLCIGGAVVDRKYFAQGALVPGSSNPARSVTGSGGVARNIAENLARLGEDVALVSRVGADDPGRRMVRELADLGVDVSGVEAFAGERTAEYVAFLNAHGEMFAAMADMAILDAIDAAEVPRWAAGFPGCDFVFAETNLDSGVLEELVAAARGAGVPLAIDAISVAKAARLPASLAGIACLFLNWQEAPAVLGLADGDGSDPEHLAKALVRRGCGQVVLTLGERGALAHDGHVPQFVPAQKVPVVEVTGAGDALAAGTMLALARGLPLKKAVAFGTHLAARTLGVAESVDPALTPETAVRFLGNRPASVS